MEVINKNKFFMTKINKNEENSKAYISIDIFKFIKT